MDITPHVRGRQSRPGSARPPFAATPRLIATLSLAAALSVAATVPALAVDPKGNDCTESYWRDSLRCVAFPTEMPQPNWGVGPAAVGEIRPYTRIFLERYSLRAVDGTRPLMYVDKAVCTDHAGCGAVAYGQPVDSNKWLVSVPGGGSCAAGDSNGDGRMDEADSCLELYADPGERDEMSSATKPAMKDMDGILSSNPDTNPVFAGYNRVRVEKVSYDRYNGLMRYHRAGGYFTGLGPGAVTIHYDLFQQGYRILRESLRMLEDGMTYPTWRDDGAGGVSTSEETLPPLSAATNVVFVGHSGGAHGMYFNIDRLSDDLARMKNFSGDVRAIIDENFLPSMANEAAFGADSLNVPLAGDLYTDQWTGHTAAGGNDVPYDAVDYYATGDLAAQYQAWGGDRMLDRSCLDTHRHTDGMTWKCKERIHVLANHISTPIFFREDFTDPNIEHTASGIGHFLVWGQWDFWPHCPSGQVCPAFLTLPQHRDHLQEQARAILDDRATRSEIALGIDDSFGGPGTVATMYAWMPSCGTHDGSYDDASWNHQFVHWQSTDWSMRSWVEDFLAQPRTGVSGRRIDGISDGTQTATSSCPP